MNTTIHRSWNVLGLIIPDADVEVMVIRSVRSWSDRAKNGNWIHSHGNKQWKFLAIFRNCGGALII